MNQQLPVLKDFKMLEAPTRKPDSWWIRLVCYLILTVSAGVLCAGGTFLSISGVIGDATDRSASFDDYARDPAAYNKRVFGATIAIGSLAFVGFGVACFAFEMERRTKGSLRSADLPAGLDAHKKNTRS